MTSRVLKAGMALAAAGAALVMTAGSASAATYTFTVSAGSAPTGTKVAITGTTTGTSPQITFKDTTTGTALNCASGTAPGFTTTGSGLAGTGIGSITGPSTGWNGCTGPGGLTLKVTGVGTWLINTKSGSSTGATGTITKVKATVVSSDGVSCKFTVTGSVPIKIANSTQTLTVLNTKSLLKVSNLTGCFGLVNNGDVANFAAVYKLTANTAAYNPLKITGKLA